MHPHYARTPVGAKLRHNATDEGAFALDLYYRNHPDAKGEQDGTRYFDTREMAIAHAHAWGAPHGAWIEDENGAQSRCAVQPEAPDKA